MTEKNDMDGYIIIYRMKFRHPKTGKIIRAKNGKPFRFRIRIKKP
jgi:hypothetical protein